MPGRHAKPRRLGLLVSLLVSAGCSSGVPSAQQTIQSYRDALKDNDPKRAYDLLGSETKAKLAYEEFSETWAKTRLERARQNQALGLSSATAREQALYEFSPYYFIRILRVKEGWRLASPTAGTLGATSPLAAVERFANALRGRQSEALLAMLSMPRQDALKSELQRFRSAIQKALIHGEGFYPSSSSRVEFRFASEARRYKILLVLEPERGWLVDDLSILPPFAKPE